MVVTKGQPHMKWREGDDVTKLEQFAMSEYDHLVGRFLTRAGMSNYSQSSSAMTYSVLGVQNLRFNTSSGCL